MKSDLPVCLGGARACPPEDCGGVRGYESVLEAIRDPDHEERDAMLEWVGGHFDP
ncbi:MAG: plasmid pRiA4b ORF-3 family protein [Candidatus Rokubacteria bacterium]|nr:plasmid pRiA4b ORF-3 family protein [Candidatus Rokubacteria bacterium]